ncbi:MAG: hypothetical protein IJ460_01585 [Clostridia bacterium]|nr:hypothetical protein [Clostridia bacterium]
MENITGRYTFLTGNMLKLIALIAMTADHIGAYLLPQYEFLRIIGRLAFPIFAYMIAEGCRYTKNRKSYLGNMIFLAFICQAAAFTATGSVNMCIIVTFSLSIILIYLLDYMIKERTSKSFFICLAALFAVYFISEMLPSALPETDYGIDYGFFGILTPVFAYIGKSRLQKLSMAAFAIILVSSALGSIQWYSLLAIPLLILYNGQRGKVKIKNLFYIYYPAHLVVIYLVGLAI